MSHKWSVDLDKTKSIEVDTKHLANIQKYLKILSDSINDDLVPYLDDINKNVAYGYDEVKSIQGDGVISNQPTAFGSSNVATIADLSKKVNSAYDKVKSSLQAIAKDLDASGKAVAKIADKYDTTDERNDASMKDFDTAFSAASSSSTGKS